MLSEPRRRSIRPSSPVVRLSTMRVADWRSSASVWKVRFWKARMSEVLGMRSKKGWTASAKLK